MSRPRFLTDEDWRFNISQAARRLDPHIEIRTAVELGLSSIPDDAVLEFAAGNGWIVLSHDVNTMTAAANVRLTRGLAMAGLFVAAQGSQMDAQIASDLATIRTASEAEEWVNRIEFLPL